MKRKEVKILGLSYSQSQVGSYVVVLSEIKGNKKLPVIMFTANPDIRSIKGSKKLGVNAYVPKFCLYTNMPSAVKEELDKIKKVIS